ncbi:MAG: hypothetical protein ACFFDI_12230, partial [Promethearchaeota archaeon]
DVDALLRTFTSLRGDIDTKTHKIRPRPKKLVGRGRQTWRFNRNQKIIDIFYLKFSLYFGSKVYG